MLQLFDPRKILPAYALTTAAIAVGVFLLLKYLLKWELEVYKIFGLASSVSWVLTMLLFSTPVPKWVWCIARCISKDIYPDLTGTWEGTITPVPASLKVLKVRARIQHSILTLFIDFHGETFDSFTLSATPLAERGQHLLHYVYQSEPKSPDRPVYKGTAILRVRLVSEGKTAILMLMGQYHTDRKTVGTIELRQTGTDATKDVSFGPHQPQPEQAPPPIAADEKAAPEGQGPT